MKDHLHSQRMVRGMPEIFQYGSSDAQVNYLGLLEKLVPFTFKQESFKRNLKEIGESFRDRKKKKKRAQR